MSTVIEFVVALVAIIVGAAFFTNAIEILGGRLGMRQGAVGSLLAAVGTALPESMIAIVAILEPVLTGEASEDGAPIGIGAILGAPLMLATLAMFVVGVSALVFRRRRDQGTRLRIDAATIGRDVGFFLVLFAGAAGVGLVELPLYIKVVVALVLAFGYGLYVRQTLFFRRASRGGAEKASIHAAQAEAAALRRRLPDAREPWGHYCGRTLLR